MNQKITLYVPATIGNEHIDNTKHVEHVADVLSQLFGGATALPVNGYWKDTETGELVKENTVQVYAFTTFWNRIKFKKKVEEIANWIKKEMNQQSVLLEVNGNVKFF